MKSNEIISIFCTLIIIAFLLPSAYAEEKYSKGYIINMDKGIIEQERKDLETIKSIREEYKRIEEAVKRIEKIVDNTRYMLENKNCISLIRALTKLEHDLAYLKNSKNKIAKDDNNLDIKVLEAAILNIKTKIRGTGCSSFLKK
jgi:hypothetical protein